MKKNEELWRQLENVLKKQKGAFKKGRRKVKNGILKENMLFYELTPVFYEEFINSLSESQFRELMNELDGEQKKLLWGSISEPCVAYIFGAILEYDTDSLLKFVPYSKWRTIFDSNFVRLFMGTKDNEYGILKEASSKVLEEFVIWESERKEEGGIKKLFDFLTAETYSEEELNVYEKLAQMTPQTIAILFKEANFEVIRNVLEKMEHENIYAVCQIVEDEKLFEILKATNFSVLDYGTDFPVWRLSKEEQRELCAVLRESKEVDINKLFDRQNIAELYANGNWSDKEYIVLEVLADYKEEYVFYGFLSKSDKMEMIEILFDYGKEAIVKDILEKKKEKGCKLDFFEKIVLKQLKNK